MFMFLTNFFWGKFEKNASLQKNSKGSEILCPAKFYFWRTFLTTVSNASKLLIAAGTGCFSRAKYVFYFLETLKEHQVWKKAAFQ